MRFLPTPLADEEKLELAATQEALAQAAATPSATPPPGSPSPSPSPSPSAPANPQKSPPPTAPDKTQPMPKPATLCHVVVTVTDVDQVACLPLGRSFLTKRESNLGFAHGMPTTFVFKQPSGVQAFTGTLSSISSIVASAVPTLINVKSTPSAPAKATQTPVAAVQSKTPGSRSGGKTTSAPAAAEALSAEETPPPNIQDIQDELNRLSQNHQQDTDTINKVRLLFIRQLKAENKTSAEINAILIENKQWPLTASELKSLSSQ